MATVLGYNTKMYYNTGTEAVPVWNELGNAKGRDFDISKNEVDVTTFDNNGWEAVVGALKSGNLDFEMVWNQDDASLAYFLNAHLSDESVATEMMVLDGGKDVDKSSGLHGVYTTLNFKQGAPIDGAVTVNVSMKLTFSPTLKPFWQKTYQNEAAAAFTAGDDCYLDEGLGTISSLNTDVYVGQAVYDSVAGATTMVDTGSVETP